MSTRQKIIVLVDDDPDDQDIVEEALGEAGADVELVTLPDGQELLDYLQGEGAYAGMAREERLPVLVLLDINMPRMNGIEALREVKSRQSLRAIPIVMLTTSRSEEDIIRSYDLGCSSFVTKPGMFETLVDLMKVLSHYWLSYVETPNLQRLIDDTLSQSQEEQ